MKILKSDIGSVLIEHDNGKRLFVTPEGATSSRTAFTSDTLLSHYRREGWKVVYEAPKPRRYTVVDGGALISILTPNGEVFLAIGSEDKAHKIADALNKAEGL